LDQVLGRPKSAAGKDGRRRKDVAAADGLGQARLSGAQELGTYAGRQGEGGNSTSIDGGHAAMA
jgi:hypothetical protein